MSLFEEFIIKLKNKINEPLPGVEAQIRLVPPNRPRTRQAYIQGMNPRKAAVLALLYPKESIPHIVFTLRKQYPGVHSGQISFPGGKVEKEDANLVETALREANEEVGVKANNIEIIGNLTDVYIPPSNFLVNPVVGIHNTAPDFIKQESEVEEILEFQLDHFLDSSNLIEKEIRVRDKIIKTPAYQINGHIIWGATAMMMSELSEIVK